MNLFNSIALSFGSALILSACANGGKQPVAEPQTSRFQSDRTFLTFDRIHGFQIEYIGKDKVALWYPGNRSVVSGTYEIGQRSGVRAICFTYGGGGMNPVTGNRNTEQCKRLATHSNDTRASLTGDPFDLQSGQVPYRLKRCEAPTEFEYELSDADASGCAEGKKVLDRLRERRLKQLLERLQKAKS